MEMKYCCHKLVFNQTPNCCSLKNYMAIFIKFLGTKPVQYLLVEQVYTYLPVAVFMIRHSFVNLHTYFLETPLLVRISIKETILCLNFRTFNQYMFHIKVTVLTCGVLNQKITILLDSSEIMYFYFSNVIMKDRSQIYLGFKSKRFCFSLLCGEIQSQRLAL